MTNTTEVFWDVDGTSLNTYAWNITTLGGDRAAPPPLRGDDVTIPYMPGTKWIPREVESRTITLGMWVQGSNEDGTMPTTESLKHKYDRNWEMLRKLLFKPRRQMTLTKRFWVLTADLTAAGVSANELTQDGEWSLYEASAKVQYVGGLTPVMHGNAHSAFTVDLKLNDPYFYSDPIEIEFDGDIAAGQTKTIQVLGDDRTHNVEMDFIGPLSAPKCQNVSAKDEEGNSLILWTQYGADVAASEHAVIRSKNFSATHYPTGVPYKTSGYVLHRGDKFWMWMEPGETDIEMTAQTGTGTAKLKYQPAWI